MDSSTILLPPFYRGDPLASGHADKKQQAPMRGLVPFGWREWNRTTDPYRVKVVL